MCVHLILIFQYLADPLNSSELGIHDLSVVALVL
jgi:hypothetical protein